MKTFEHFAAAACGLLILVCAVIVLVAASTIWIGYFTADGNLAAVEAIRSASVDAGKSDSSGIMALAAQANAWIAWHHALNENPWTGWAIPDQWSKVKPIRIKRLFRERQTEPGPMGYVPDKKGSEEILKGLKQTSP